MPQTGPINATHMFRAVDGSKHYINLSGAVPQSLPGTVNSSVFPRKNGDIMQVCHWFISHYEY